MLSRYRAIGLALVLGMGGLVALPLRAADIDSDGVDDPVDVCINTPAGAVVDAQGRPLGDLDGDCDTDLIDHALFAACLNGPNMSPAAGCASDADLDNDGDADTADYALLQRGFTGFLIRPNMALVPAGEFQMGDTFNEGQTSERPVHAVYVDSFYIDKLEVTNQQYADALNWAMSQGTLITVTDGVVYKFNTGTSYPYCDTTSSSSYSRMTWNGSTFGAVAGKGDHPMARVSWYGSVAFANWRSAMERKPLCYDRIDEIPPAWECNYGVGSYRLPTEAEWEKAARGGVSGHRFPWSDTDTIQHTRANYWSYWEGGAPHDPYDTNPTQGYHPLWGVSPSPYTSPVGFFTGALQHQADWGWPGSLTSYQTTNSANGFGLYDMAGNVREWCNDWWSQLYYINLPYNNPHGPTSGTWRVTRGGSWGSSASGCRCAARGTALPGNQSHHRGFRLVLDAE